MILRGTERLFVLVTMETGLIVLAVGLSAYLRLGDDMFRVSLLEYGLPKSALLAGVTQLCLYYADLYDLRAVSDRRELFIRTLEALGAAALVLAAIYFWFPQAVIGRGVFLIASILIIGLVVGWRMVFDWFGRRMSPRERLLIVGTNAAALTLARELHERRNELGVAISGFVDADPSKVGQPVINPGVIGTIDDIPSIVQRGNVDRVVVSLADARGKLPMDRLLEMRLGRGVTFSHLASVYEEYTGKIAVENLRPSWLIFSEGFRQSTSLAAAKRTMDLMAALGGLVVAAPLMLVVAALIRMTSRGPVLYHQERIGRHGRPFTIHKFRSMRVDAETGTGPVWAAANDARVTPVGKMLRRTRLDELPQLWNVLVGEMSLVGPRPERPSFVGDLTKSIPFYGLRHGMRPGVTGWAQVRYTYGASVEDAMEKLQYDLFYLKHFSIAFDFYILLATVKTVIQRRGA